MYKATDPERNIKKDSQFEPIILQPITNNEFPNIWLMIITLQVYDDIFHWPHCRSILNNIDVCSL